MLARVHTCRSVGRFKNSIRGQAEIKGLSIEQIWQLFLPKSKGWLPPYTLISDGHAVSLMSVYAMSIALVGWKVYCPNMAKYTRRIINDPLKWAVGQRELDDKHFSPLSAALTTAPATLVAGTLLAKVGPIQLCFLIVVSIRISVPYAWACKVIKLVAGQRELDDKYFSPLSAALTTAAPATLVAGTLLAKVGPIQVGFLMSMVIKMSTPQIIFISYRLFIFMPKSIHHFIDAPSSLMPPLQWCLLLINASSSLMPLLH